MISRFKIHDLCTFRDIRIMKKMKIVVWSVSLIGSLLLVATVSTDKGQSNIVKHTYAFLESLDKDQRSIVSFEFEDRTREIWHYLPLASFNRPGISLGEMTEKQKRKVFNLLGVSLSEEGYHKAESIIDLENVLRDLENNNPTRDPDQYHISIYGDPDDEGIWGYNFEGHHISFNFTFVKGKLSTSPTFLGANPAEVMLGPSRGLRVLKDEEDLGLELINALPSDQRAQAIFRDISPYEIVTSVATELGPLLDVGIRFAELSEDHQTMLRSIIDEYINIMPRDVAKARHQGIEAGGYNDIHFAWAGPTSREAGHYYRVQGPTFLIEFDNTQSDANHIHTIWRDFKGDFGRDLLKEHYHNAGDDHGH